MSHFKSPEKRRSSRDNVKCENVNEMESVRIVGASSIGLKDRTCLFPECDYVKGVLGDLRSSPL